MFALREHMPREQWPATRTYTIRWLDLAARELAIDFVVHGDEGLAGPWAANAKPGDRLIVSGPGAGYKPNPEADWYLFAGDDAAIPAIASSIEALPADAVGRAYLEVDDEADIQADHRPRRSARSTGCSAAANRPAPPGCWPTPWRARRGNWDGWTSLPMASVNT